MTSYEVWLLQVRMKTSYNSEHPLLEREKEINKYTHTQEGGPQDTESRNAGLQDVSQDVICRTQHLHRNENLNSFLK
jgi:hypothetical protein